MRLSLVAWLAFVFLLFLLWGTLLASLLGILRRETLLERIAVVEVHLRECRIN